MPCSPSSGYWSTNEDEVLTSDLSLSPPTCWLLLSPRPLTPDDGQLPAEVKQEPEMDEGNRRLLLQMTDDGDDLDFGSEVDPPTLLPNGSSLLADFLFNDFLDPSPSPPPHPRSLLFGDVDDVTAFPVAFSDPEVDRPERRKECLRISDLDLGQMVEGLSGDERGNCRLELLPSDAHGLWPFWPCSPPSSSASSQFLDRLLFDVISRSPSDDVTPKVIVAAKRKSEEETDGRPLRLLRTKRNEGGGGEAKDQTTSGGDDSSTPLVTSSVEQDDEIFGKNEEQEWNGSTFNPFELFGVMADDGASAVRSAEVLATMLTSQDALREPNRGSDVIYEELKTRRDLVTSSSSGRSEQSGGAASLRAFLMQRRLQALDKGRNQGLLHRLLKGQTTEAEIRREMKAEEQV